MTNNSEYAENTDINICRHKILLTAFYLVATIMMFRRINELASFAASFDNSSNSLYLARIAEINGEGYGQATINLMRINIAIGILSAAETIKAVFEHKKVSIFNYIIIVYSVVFSVLRGSRTDMMYLLGAYLFTVLYYSYKRITDKRKACKKALKVLFIFLLLIAVIWAISGIAFSRSGGSAIKSLLGYVGGPLAGLNYLFDHPGYIESNAFGERTFDSIYAMLGRFGIAGSLRRNAYLPYTCSNGFSINVYTMYGRFITDFGVFGSFVITTAFGLIYGFLCARLRDNTNSEKETLSVIMNSVFMYPLLMCFFDERLFSYINNTIYVIIFIFILRAISKSKFASKRILIKRNQV